MNSGRAWCYIPLILTLGRQKQVGLGEFGANLVYVESSRPVRGT